jgi:hypothetical protein
MSDDFFDTPGSDDLVAERGFAYAAVFRAVASPNIEATLLEEGLLMLKRMRETLTLPQGNVIPLKPSQKSS